MVSSTFHEKDDLSIDELIALKASKTKDPATGRQIGFDSYNARVETVVKRYSYEQPWAEGLRMVTLISGFLERANWGQAPADKRNCEWEILVNADGLHFGSIYDTVNKQGQTL